MSGNASKDTAILTQLCWMQDEVIAIKINGVRWTKESNELIAKENENAGRLGARFAIQKWRNGDKLLSSIEMPLPRTEWLLEIEYQ